MALSPSPDVHIANVDGDIVLLDAVRDDYLCIGRRVWRSTSTAAWADTNVPSDVAKLLVDQGLLVEKARAPRPAPLARSARSDLRAFPAPRVRARDIALLALAAVRTAIWLRYRTPARWFDDLGRRPSRSRRDCAASCAAAARFMQLRPLVPRSGRCLIQSMMMLHFLRLQGLDATWVFGVRTFPFEAHCWLEHDGIVLDDSAEHVAWFTPIVRVA